MKKYILLVLITLCIPRITLSQVETHYYLKGYQFEDKSPMKIVDNKRNQVITKLPSFDKEKMLKEDLEMKGLDVPYRFGKGFDVMLSLENGQWADVEGGRLWSMTFESEDALSLNFIFTDFHLSDDAYLYITNEDKTVIYGPVRTKDTTKDGFFMTDLIKGSCATIYLFEPTSQEEMSTLIIKRVVHGYKEVFANMENGALGASADCNIDVACHPEYEKESNAVGMVLLSNGTEWCSGSLLMTTDYSFAPYFLTAFHCIDINSDGSLSNAEISNAQKWLFKFNYKLSTCGGSSLSPSYTYNSDTFMAGNHDTDFALVKLNNDLRANTNLTWVGWDHTGRTPVSGACLHHPVGDVMKVSLEDDPFSSSSWNGSIVNHWLVNFDHGIVQKGSSGSPLFDDSLRVVGQLHGGPPSHDYCLQKTGLYGKFHLSWTGGGTNSTRLSNWLDPIGSDQLTMNSYKCPYLSGHTVITDSATYSVGNLPEGATVSWSLDAVYSNDIDFFTDNPEANQCKIIRRLMVPYADTLRAVVYLGGEELITLKKAIYAHSSHFYAIYDQMPSAGNTGAHGIITASTGITYIYGGAPVAVFSPNFTGMTITPVTPYSGQYTFSRVDDTSICLSLSSNSVYPLIIRVSSDDGNEAYTLNFNLISGGNYFLSVQSSGSSYELQLMNDGEGKAGSKGMKASQEGTACWQLEVYQALTGRKMLSRNVTGRTAAFDTSTWDAGVYLINATIGDDKVSKKINVTK